MTDITTTETITITEPDGTTVEVSGLRGPQGIQGEQGLPGDVGAGALLAASNLSDLASASTARTNLGLGTAAVVNTGTGPSNAILGNDARLTDARTPTAHAASHASAGSDPLTLAQSQVADLTTDLTAKAAKSANLSDLASASTARTNLGLGNAATKDVGTGSTNVSAGNHTHSGMVTSSQITTIVALTQAEYDALGSPSATALYFING